MRDLTTRTRKKLTGERTCQKNRIHKILQDANVKLSSVATDVFGVSGKAMILCSLWRRMNDVVKAVLGAPPADGTVIVKQVL